jgi:UDP-N-acetylmuramyl-tripeptide synthetase
VRSSVLGGFNAHNILGVLGVLACSGVELDDAVAAIEKLQPVPGRMQMIREDGLPLVVVDYSHTPDALQKALQALRDLLKPAARLHCVFGAGGDRDTGKRSSMGEIATRLADQSTITSDNPRWEDPLSIINDIVAGAHPGYRVEPDRAAAIRATIHAAAPDDIVLIAGKGHENYQEIRGERLPFSDLAVARAAMSNAQPVKRATGAKGSASAKATKGKLNKRDSKRGPRA